MVPTGQDWQLILTPSCMIITIISLTSLTAAASLIATPSTLASFVVAVAVGRTASGRRCRHGGYRCQEQDKQQSQLHIVSTSGAAVGRCRRPPNLYGDDRGHRKVKVTSFRAQFSYTPVRRCNEQEDNCELSYFRER